MYSTYNTSFNVLIGVVDVKALILVHANFLQTRRFAKIAMLAYFLYSLFDKSLNFSAKFDHFSFLFCRGSAAICGNINLSSSQSAAVVRQSS